MVTEQTDRTRILLTLEQVAQQTGFSLRTVELWVYLKKLQKVKLGRSVRIRQSEVDRIVDEGTEAAVNIGRKKPGRHPAHSAKKEIA